jgi:peptidoglycan hydrolase CwlO-like protein
MSIDTSMSEEQTALTMKKQLLGELWNEIRRAVEILKVARSENESLKQNLAKSSAEIERLKSQISDLEKMLTARETSSSSGFEEREKNRLIEVARELISKIDTQLSLF